MYIIIPDIQRMNLNDLVSKVSKIRDWYKDVFKSCNLSELEPVLLTKAEEKLFSSASRWHVNSHLRLILIELYIQVVLKTHFIILVLVSG